jgi:glycosyltransferase involved in cell wall biosynthesis
MHLLLIHQNFPGQFRDLAPAWLAAGHRVSAIGQQPEPPPGPAWQCLHYLHYSFAEPEPSALQRGQAVAQISGWIQQQGQAPDLVLVHSGWGEALQLRSVFPTTPIVVYPELWGTPASLGVGVDAALNHNNGLPGLQPLLERHNLLAELAIHQATAVVVPSPSQLESFPAALRPKLELIAEGVNLSQLRPDPAARLEVEGLPLLKAGDPLVTLVSRQLEPLRGLRAALEAWPLVAAAHPEARLVLVGGQARGYGLEAPQGTSHLEDALNALPTELDRSRIHVLEPLPYPSLVALLQCSACHLGLGYPYTLSWSLLEAMACGAPLISNPESPIAPHLQHGRDGLVVPFGDAQALATAILELLQEPLQRSQIGLAGRQLIERQFNLSHALTLYEDLFARLSPPR